MRGRRRLAAAATIVVALGTTSCVRTAPTAQGRETADLYQLFAVIAAVIFVIVAALIGWSILRYRKAPDDDVLPDQFRANVKLEILWFAIPQAIVIGLFIASALVLSHERDLGGNAALTVEVEAFQWGWRFSYAGSNVTVESLPDRPAELVVPTDEGIAFLLSSRDVMHSFYVPAFLVKRDVIPGRTNRLDVTIEEPGEYTARCAEFCGLLHDRMDVTVRAVAPTEFAAWLEDQEASDVDG